MIEIILYKKIIEIVAEEWSIKFTKYFIWLIIIVVFHYFIQIKKDDK